MPRSPSSRVASTGGSSAAGAAATGNDDDDDGVVVDERSEQINSILWTEVIETKEYLANINHAQSFEHNLDALKKAGGIPNLLQQLHISSSETGIDLNTVETRRTLFGENVIPSTARKSFWQLFVDTFDDATLQILMVSAAVSLVVGMYEDPTAGWIEGCAILTAVLVVSVVTAANDYQKESQFRELSAANDAVDVVVVRAGGHWQIPVDELVVGDLIRLETGVQIPCDGVLVSSDGLQVDESALTGEAVDVDKSVDGDCFVLSGCTVEAGHGLFVAIAVGKDSQWGIIKSHLEKEQEDTPLQEKLDDMAALIGYVGTGAAVLTFVSMMLIKIILRPDYLQDVSTFHYALEAFILGVTIVVVAVPEGLPLAVTISLAFSTKKMLADQNLIRHLAACETMGNATNICSDKTGTLTENRMAVVRGVFADTRCDDTVHRVPTLISKEALHYILECIACCSTARIVQTTTASSSGGSIDGDGSVASNNNTLDASRAQIIGNKTEAALLLLAQSEWSFRDDTDQRRAEARFGKKGGSRLFPFRSARKVMSVLVNKPNGGLNSSQHGKDGGNNGGGSSSSSPRQAVTNKSWTLYHKGAAEIVLENCSHYTDIDGTEKKLTKEKRKEYKRLITELATGSLRPVALAHKLRIESVLNNNTDPAKVSEEDVCKFLERDMVLDAIAGIMDPLRADVVQAVDTVQKAGIFVRMVTGDNLDTATAIAKACGILTEGGLAMTGGEFRKLTPSQLDKVLPRLQVLARSSPEDKHVLVQRLNGALMPETKEKWLEIHPGKNYESERDALLPGYRQEWLASRMLSNGGVGEVVGVTGDGTNDGPALKAADVGLSMGLCGTDVAKKASDIIIMDDNFSSIVKAVLWGRSVFDNIRKFLQFQLTVNVVALTLTFLSAVEGYRPPLNAVMMLWVNLIMDTMGALALGTEPPRQDLLERRPYRRDASLISRPMWRNILCQALFQLAVLVFLLKRGPDIFGVEDGSRHHFTIIFNAFVFCQVFNEFNAREIGDRFDPIRSLSQSPMFLAVIAFTVVAQWAIIEYGGEFTQTYNLDYREWKYTVGLGAMSLPVGYVMRCIPVQEDPNSFAGIETHRKNSKDDANRNKPSFWLTLIVVLVPIFVAIVYQLRAEMDEFIHVEGEED